METWIIVLIVMVVVVPLLLVGLIVMAGSKFLGQGYCFTKDNNSEGCALNSKQNCSKQNGTHFDTMKECQDYWNSQKPKKENYSVHC